MNLCTSEQMRSIDRRAIESFGLSGFTLMDRAGASVAAAAERMLHAANGARVIILCGKGNNGGDGFVIARYLAQSGVHVRCLLFADRVAVSGHAATHLAAAEQAGVSVEVVTETTAARLIFEADLIVDALLGVGLNGLPRGLARAGIRLINTSLMPVLSVDVPSGLTPDAGYPDPSSPSEWACVRADRTVTIGLMKADLAMFPGRAWAGEVEVADIGIPEEAVRAEKLWMSMPDAAEMRTLLPQRNREAHKGDCGRVAIIAGSVGMTGAAALTSRAVMRSGAGMAMLGVPASLADVMAAKLTEVMIRPMPETPERTLSLAALDHIEALLAWGDVLAIGPGLSRHQDTEALVRQVVTHANCPAVVDADGLNAFAGHSDLWASRQADVVITPHVGELARLIDRPASDITADRIAVARRTAQSLNVTLTLKGASTLVASPSGSVSVNPTGNEGMATAGAGDVLTGVIAGLLAQGLSAWDAARLGVYLHGLAGDIGASQLGMHSLTAGDLVDCLPAAFLKAGSA